MLKVGSINLEKERNLISFKIRDRKLIKKVLFPIFDKYPLITSKKLDYGVFKEACTILDNSTLTQQEKNLLIFKLKENLKIIKEELSSNNFKNIENYNTISMNNEWLVGFWEAEGSFFIVKKEEAHYSHVIGITQKLDKIILNTIKKKLKIPGLILYRKEHNFYKLESSNSRVLENVIKFFDSKLLGVKSLEFKIWKRTLKFKKDPIKMQKIQLLLQKIRSFRPTEKNHESIFNLYIKSINSKNKK
jgi:hypothetical protein